MNSRCSGEDKRPETVTESTDSVLLICEGPGDRTIRPRRPNNPRFWPKDVPFPPPVDGNGEHPE